MNCKKQSKDTILCMVIKYVEKQARLEKCTGESAQKVSEQKSEDQEPEEIKKISKQVSLQEFVLESLVGMKSQPSLHADRSASPLVAPQPTPSQCLIVDCSIFSVVKPPPAQQIRSYTQIALHLAARAPAPGTSIQFSAGI